MKNWFVIQTKPHKELQVHTLLSKGGFEAYYPKARELMYRGRVSYLTLKPLFPSYIFVHVDFMQERHFHLVKFTRGVSQVLCQGDRPTPVPEPVMREIQSRTDVYGVLEWHKSYRKGQKVRIKRGPFKDLTGVLDKPCSAEERVRVLLQVINYKVNALFHWSEIENISVPSTVSV